MSAIKSKNRDHVFINKNFLIRVRDLKTNKCVLASANTLSRYLDEIPKNSLFGQLLNAKWDKRTFLYRERLKIDIVSK